MHSPPTPSAAHLQPPERIPAGPAANPLTLILAVASVLLGLNAALACLLEHYPVNAGYALVQKKWRLLQETAEVDILILGDSSCNQGIQSELVQQTLGGTALNLCSIGDMTVLQDAWQLREYLQRHRPPRAVIIGHTYDAYTRDAAKLRRTVWNIVRTGTELATLSPQLELGALDRAYNAVAPYLPLYVQAQALRNVLTGGGLPQLGVQADGFMPEVESDPTRVEQDTADHLEELSASTPALSDVNAAGLQALAQLSLAHKLPLFVVLAPAHDQLAQSPRLQERLVQLAPLIEAQLAVSPYATYALQQPMPFPADAMQNADHVLVDAARAYTRAVLAAIRPYLEAPREAAPDVPGQH